MAGRSVFLGPLIASFFLAGCGSSEEPAPPHPVARPPGIVKKATPPPAPDVSPPAPKKAPERPKKVVPPPPVAKKPLVKPKKAVMGLAGPIGT